MRPNTGAIIDWSGGNQGSVRPRKDAIWAGLVRDGVQDPPRYFRHRQAIEQWLHELIEGALVAGRRLFLGFDFPFGYPVGFGEWLCGSADPFDLWAWFAARIKDGPTANNRFEIASDINARTGQIGPFWGCPAGRATPHLPMRKSDRAAQQPFPELRLAEQRMKGTFSLWQLAYAGSVGSQTIMGLPVLERLRQAFPGQIAVWPFEPLDRPVSFVEVWPSVLAAQVRAQADLHPIRDAVQVQLLARAVSCLSEAEMQACLTAPPSGEGWIFAMDQRATLKRYV